MIMGPHVETWGPITIDGVFLGLLREARHARVTDHNRMRGWSR